MAWTDDIVTLLEGAGVGTFGVSIFASTKASIPLLPSGLASVQIITQPGSAPEHTHNATVTPAYLRPSAVIVTRADNWPAAEAKARATYDALFIRNTPVNGRWYREVSPINEIHDIGRDERGQTRASFTITAIHSTGAVVMPEALIADFDGEAFAFQTPGSSDVYPTGATFDKLVPGSAPFVLNNLKIPAGNYVLEASAKVSAAGARAKVGLFNLTLAPDTPIVEIEFTTSELVGERKRSGIVPIPAGDNVYGVKLTVNSTTIQAAAWGCRLMRT